MKNKRFLITQNSLRLLAGSEMVVLELAEYLKSQGAQVVVYTCFYHDPIKRYFEKRNINVVTSDKNFSLEDFDYIWVQHQILPISIINQLGGPLPAKMPVFLFLHMSALVTHFLEQPYIWDMELKLSAKSLFVSEKTRLKSNRTSFNIDRLNDTGLFRNPAPVKVAALKHSPRSKIKKILIVSNHPPEEVLRAKEELIKLSYQAESLGEDQDEYKLIEPEYLTKFDVVITIGKTVQYCLTAGVPVYIYDYFGGPGYLNDDNEIESANRNYSGRGFSKKKPQEIVDEIIKNYDKAVKFQTENRSRFISELSIDKVLPGILSDIKPKKIQPFDKYYLQYLKGVIVMMRYKFYHENELIVRSQNLEAAKQWIDHLDNVIKQKNGTIEDITSSKSYKIGAFITKPARLIKRRFKKVS